MSKQAVALIAGLLVAGLLVVGCGGDDDNDASAGSPAAETTSADADADAGGGDDGAGDEGTASLTKAAFIKQGDAICAESSERVTAEATKLVQKNGGALGGNKEFEAEIVEQALAPELQTVVDDLEALPVPSGDEEQIEALLDVLGERADLANEDLEGFIEAEGKRGGPLYKEAQALAKQYGFKECMQ